MNLTLSGADKSRFEEIRKLLTLLGSKEGTFIKVELLFYEALTLAKTYGEDIESNPLLVALRNVQTGAYQKTRISCKTSTEKERHIHQFIVQFKKAISNKPTAF